MPQGIANQAKTTMASSIVLRSRQCTAPNSVQVDQQLLVPNSFSAG
jgi:hypothetical protein